MPKDEKLPIFDCGCKADRSQATELKNGSVMKSPDTRGLANHFADAWALDSRMQNSFFPARMYALLPTNTGEARVLGSELRAALTNSRPGLITTVVPSRPVRYT